MQDGPLNTSKVVAHFLAGRTSSVTPGQHENMGVCTLQALFSCHVLPKESIIAVKEAANTGFAGLSAGLTKATLLGIVHASVRRVF